MAHLVTLIPGDGIGPEVSEATRRVLDATGVPIEWVVEEAGADALAREGTTLPGRVLDRIRDSRDEGGKERLKILSEKTGVFRCRTTFNCTDACPRGIEVTKAIQEVKRSILFDRF